MPIYEYLCEECQTRYERVVLSQSAEVRCPRCGSERRALQLSVFSTSRNASRATRPSEGSSTGCGCTPQTCGCN